jgi:hypothetical protein
MLEPEVSSQNNGEKRKFSNEVETEKNKISKENLGAQRCELQTSGQGKKPVIVDLQEIGGAGAEDEGEESYNRRDEDVEDSDRRDDAPIFKILPPHLPRHMIKGKSKSNLSKGKRPVNNLLYPIQGDLIPTQNSAMKKFFELSEESIRYDRMERIRNTLKIRVTELNERKLYSLEDVVKVFLSESIPLSLKLPVQMSSTSISTLLLLEETSEFVESLRPSVIFQDTIRRYLLEEKNLPTCRCGYIYVHPCLTYSKHPNQKHLMVGNMGDVIAVEHTKTVLKRLNALRFFLEILFTNITTE